MATVLKGSDTLNMSFRAVRKITCLGSGFVGGMKASQDPTVLHTTLADSIKVQHPP